MRTSVVLIVLYLSINLSAFSQITRTFNSNVGGWAVSDINQNGNECTTSADEFTSFITSTRN